VANALNRLLELNQTFALNAVGTTNHCPMALMALAEMGASPLQLQVFFDSWTRKHKIETLMGLDKPPHHPTKHWSLHLNQPDAFGELKTYFSVRLQTETTTQLLTELITEHAFAPATGAFHALIRMGYAIEHDHAAELASGLAAYVVGYRPLPVAEKSASAAKNVLEALKQLRSVYGDSQWTANQITARFTDIANDARLVSSLQHPPNSHDLIAQMSAHAVQIYLQTQNFTALHMVTGIFAARLFLDKLQQPLNSQILGSLWSSFCIAYISIGAPDIDFAIQDTQQTQTPNWPSIFNCALQSQDDHLIKMVYTCWREFTYSGKVDFWVAAQMAARQLDFTQ
jgi:Questin oxidase-like